MTGLANWQAVLAGIVMAVIAILLVIWWRQQTFRWPIVLIVSIVLAPALCWWSGIAFQIADYRAGCDGLCPGFRGAPVPIFQGESAGGQLMPVMFVLGSIVYFVALLGWSGVLRAILLRISASRNTASWIQVLLTAVLLIGPLALAPLYLPPPEAHVRGDPLRISINARRELYLYSDSTSTPILRVGLEDVRPRRDGSQGMRVCLRSYTYFYIPNGHVYLDMTLEGVHSNGGGFLPLPKSCWE